MSKLRVIDLLNKIANGEKVPEKIVIDNTKLVYDEGCQLFLQDYYVKEEDNNATWEIWSYNLNDEVEIIKEDKKIEKLESYISCGWNGTCKDLKREYLFNDLEKIGSKINEIIDRINNAN